MPWRQRHQQCEIEQKPLWKVFPESEECKDQSSHVDPVVNHVVEVGWIAPKPPQHKSSTAKVSAGGSHVLKDSAASFAREPAFFSVVVQGLRTTIPGGQKARLSVN